ncbi:PadR family transcriptional regulator [Brevibacillus sp. NPDC003359]|uniref:PadR family transcriptional regulator n=1 Tax=unclassified Brevibacillus TaxID=2684853 RepID=UPI003694D05E
MNSYDLSQPALQPLTGYEIKKLLEEFFSHFYRSTYGTIYPMLTRMEKEGLITKEVVPQDGKPNKKVLTITDKGRECFNDYLIGPLEQDSTKSDFLMRLYFGEFVGYDRVMIWLTQAQEDAQIKLKELQQSYLLHKNEMHPAQIICIQIGINEYSAKLETIAQGMLNIEQLELKKQ